MSLLLLSFESKHNFSLKSSSSTSLRRHRALQFAIYGLGFGTGFLFSAVDCQEQGFFQSLLPCMFGFYQASGSASSQIGPSLSTRLWPVYVGYRRRAVL